MSAETLTDPVDERAVPSASPCISYEEFLSAQYDGIHAEWVDGEVVPMSPISGIHQDLGLFLLGLLIYHTGTNLLGTIRYEPFQMKADPELPGRSPDILFVARDHLDRLKPTFLEGPADLVVEIVCPESGPRDRGDKFFEYERGGVREYWLIDPLRRQAEFYRLSPRGIYEAVSILEGRFQSEVVDGFWIEVDWLWQQPQLSMDYVIERWNRRGESN